MTTQLTPVLLDFLIAEGYCSCLSKTQPIQSDCCSNLITLKPMKQHLLAGHLPLGFDSCFALQSEPLQMAQGINGVMVMVDITPVELTGYIGYVFSKQLNH